MKYAVTFCSTDTRVGSNPFWHSCILLSKMNEDLKKLEVVDNWGFYGLPASDKSASWTRNLKLKLGLDVDLNGNHGMLRHEETRFLDRGMGLHGVTFELSEEQFKLLEKNCKDMEAQQQAAIIENAEFLKIPAKAKENTRIYAYEDYSALIYAMEKAKAAAEGRPSRLKPFEFRASLGLFGPSLKESHTCKSQMINLLATVLSDKQIARLTEKGKHPTIPRLSGDVEEFFLHSTGTLSVHEKASGETAYFRDDLSDKVRLFWTLPPQKYESLSDETERLFKLDEEHCESLKKLVSHLQRAEWAVRNAVVGEQYKKYKEDLLALIIQSYEQFAIIAPKEDTTKTSGLFGFALSLLALPRSKDQSDLLAKIKQGNYLLNALYMAMVDGWEFTEEPIDGPASAKDSVISSDDASKDGLDSDLVAVASLFSIKSKKAVCAALGRSYVEPLALEEYDEDDIEPERTMVAAS